MSTLPETFWAKVSKTGACWLWTGAVTSSGYGSFGHEGRVQSAHRLAYVDAKGPIPDGYTIDHVRAWGCLNRTCVNPAHLEAVTVAENNARSLPRTSPNCKYGHPLIHRPGDRQRRCLECTRESVRRSRAKAAT